MSFQIGDSVRHITIIFISRIFSTKQNLRMILLMHSSFREANLTYYNNYHLLNCQMLFLLSLTGVNTNNECLFRHSLDILYRIRHSVQKVVYPAADGWCSMRLEGIGNSGLYSKTKDKHYNSVHVIDFLFSNTCP